MVPASASPNSIITYVNYGEPLPRTKLSVYHVQRILRHSCRRRCVQQWTGNMSNTYAEINEHIRSELSLRSRYDIALGRAHSPSTDEQFKTVITTQPPDGPGSHRPVKVLILFSSRVILPNMPALHNDISAHYRCVGKSSPAGSRRTHVQPTKQKLR